MVQFKSFLKWAGGKTRVVEELVNLIKSKPLNCDWTIGTGERYYEPFLGSGAMFFGLKAGKDNMGVNIVNLKLFHKFEYF